MLRGFNDLSDLFATNPTLVERQIGLIPADFVGFHFHRQPKHRMPVLANDDLLG